MIHVLFVLPLFVLLGPGATAAGAWTHYAADARSTKFSPLTQIDSTNFDQVRLVWRWRVPDRQAAPQVGDDIYRSTPVVVDGTLFTSTPLNQVVALDAVTGEEHWRFDPEVYKTESADMTLHRGVTHWRDGERERVFFGTSSSFLYALDAATGRPDPAFGEGGRVDLAQGLRQPVDRSRYAVASAPTVIRGVVVVGSTIQDWRYRPPEPVTSPGDVRGFDARTGKTLWTFHTIPQEGEYGNDTWENDAWKTFGAANVWAVISADEELGYIYLAVSTPSHDFYGGERPGANLYGDSIVCLDARTGERVWHYQLIHHGLWDYDPPSAPILADIEVGGKRIKAVAQLTKQGFCYVFDRVSGEPVWPIEERPVPQAPAVAGEAPYPTQPFPTKPAAFDRQGIGPDDLIDFTPELRAEALEILRGYDYGPLYTPPSERGTVLLPGLVGGADWVGGALHPESGVLYVPSHTIPAVVSLEAVSGATSRYLARTNELGGPRGLPLTKPPYGRLTAINLNNGEHLWTRPVGRGPVKHPALRHLDLPDLGWQTRTFVAATPTLLLATSQQPFSFGGGGDYFVDPKAYLEAYALDDGRLIGRVELPAHPYGNPAVYESGGRQYVAVPVGGRSGPGFLAVLALPRPDEKLPPQGLQRSDADHPRYYDAVAALDGGDEAALQALLRAQPDLVQARGWLDEHYEYPSFRGATLLHHLAGNPIRAELPDNALVLAKILLRAGADPDALTLDSTSTLGLSVSSAQLGWKEMQGGMIALLVEGGADLNSDKGRTLWMAITNQQQDAAEALYKNGASLDLRFAAALGLTDRLAGFFDPAGALRDDVPLLYRPGPERASPNRQQRLDEALGMAATGGHLEAAAFLLDKGADINSKPAWLTWPDDRGNTPLHKAVSAEDEAMVRYLLERGADPTIQDNNYSSTPGGWAMYFGNNALGRILVAAEAAYAEAAETAARTP